MYVCVYVCGFMCVCMSGETKLERDIKLKNKKNIEKSKKNYSGSGFGYRWEVGPFSERP